MKKVTLLMGAMAFALVAQTEAATTKVTFTLNGYYQVDRKATATNKVSAGTIRTYQDAVVPFKITDADFTTNKGAYLIATNRSSSSSSSPNEVDLVDGTNAPYKVLDMVVTSADKSINKTFEVTKNSNTTYQTNNASTTSYSVVGISLPATYNRTLGGTTNGGTVATAIVPSIFDYSSTVVIGPRYVVTNSTGAYITSQYPDNGAGVIAVFNQTSTTNNNKPNFAVKGAGVAKSSTVLKSDGTRSDTLSASFNNVVGTASVIPAHATNGVGIPTVGVIVSGVIKAVKSN
jgi:hypothetical protein